MKKKNYENFSLPLALFDALPVIFFGAAMILIAARFGSKLFIAGAVICTFAGLGKVIWKIIIAATKKDVAVLNIQLRVLMPIGFAFLISGAIIGMDAERWAVLKSSVLSFPSAAFFAVTVIGMIMMSVFAVKLDQTKARSNWIEQITNAVSQFCFLLGVLSCQR